VQVDKATCAAWTKVQMTVGHGSSFCRVRRSNILQHFCLFRPEQSAVTANQRRVRVLTYSIVLVAVHSQRLSPHAPHHQGPGTIFLVKTAAQRRERQEPQQRCLRDARWRERIATTAPTPTTGLPYHRTLTTCMRHVPDLWPIMRGVSSPPQGHAATAGWLCALAFAAIASARAMTSSATMRPDLVAPSMESM